MNCVSTLYTRNVCVSVFDGTKEWKTRREIVISAGVQQLWQWGYTLIFNNAPLFDDKVSILDLDFRTFVIFIYKVFSSVYNVNSSMWPLHSVQCIWMLLFCIRIQDRINTRWWDLQQGLQPIVVVIDKICLATQTWVLVWTVNGWRNMNVTIM